MPMTTTEVPTFFGPSDSPLFGVLHFDYLGEGDSADQCGRRHDP
jgi:hypothetical protein